MSAILTAFGDKYAGLSMMTLQAKPEGSGRALLAIAEHVTEAHAAYLRYAVGKVPGLSEATRGVKDNTGRLSEVMTEVWKISAARVAAMNEKELIEPVPHGQITWTARRMMRRMLEHAWEHLVEVTARLDQASP